MLFGEQVIHFHLQLKPNWSLPSGIIALNPFQQDEGRRVFTQFYQEYYSDHRPRHFLFGINPGRFGAGLTGISFTDPIRLERACGIANNFPKKGELSSEFIYQVIEALGGPHKFFNHFYVTAVSPLGFIRDGVNINYYDDNRLLKVVEPFALQCIDKQLQFGCKQDQGICIGQGANFRYFKQLNQRYHWFKEVTSLPHPRWIMQYQRKKLAGYVQEYVDTLAPMMSAP